VAVAILWPLLVPSLVAAQQSPLSSPLNSEDPIQITADNMEADNHNRTFVFKGHVKVVQGPTVINADQLKVWYRGEGQNPSEGSGGSNRIRDIEAAGHVVILFDGRTATSDKALYSADAQTLTLLGDKATIVDGPNTISGAKITLYRAEDRIKVEGSSEKRVEAVFFPNEKKPSE
jgi:lipopolysaccharide export system protein LptA